MPLSPEKLRAAREKKGLTHREVAERAGMKREAYSRIESGARLDPVLSTAQRIADALGVKLETLTE